VSVINEYEHNSETKPFDVFNNGADLWKTEQFQDDFIDRIRMYVEECDNMQVKVTVSVDRTTVTQLSTLLIQIKRFIL
jgi:regulatory protein YycH of two-component signal transduction system YycFG